MGVVEENQRRVHERRPFYFLLLKPMRSESYAEGVAGEGSVGDFFGLFPGESQKTNPPGWRTGYGSVKRVDLIQLGEERGCRASQSTYFL